jgi:hypothetical protein
MDSFDRFWQWATKPLESQLTIPAELHRAVMELLLRPTFSRSAHPQCARVSAVPMESFRVSLTTRASPGDAHHLGKERRAS